MTNTTFQPGNTYTFRFISDSTMTFEVPVISRTAKTVKAIVEGKTKTFRISDWDGVEMFKPLGSYSMAPIVRADRTA